MSEITTEDGREALAAARAAERLNRADMPMDRGGRDPFPPWRLALVRMFRPEQFDTEADESLLYDGDRPADLTDDEITYLSGWDPENRQQFRTHDSAVLTWREFDMSAGDSIQSTHSAVHRALAGEDYETRYERIKREGGVITETTATEAQTGPTIRGCKWCASGQ